MGDFNYAILRDIAHRPWPLPARPWLMSQTWHDLLFAHWTVPPAPLAALLPAGLELDLFNGQAWVGIVPFHMTNVAPRGMTALGWSPFPEINVRTYVRVGDRPGVYFFSLDAGSGSAVLGARIALNLPYFMATMIVVRHEQGIVFTSDRRGHEGSAHFDAQYRPDGPAGPAHAGSLEYFLTERYCLYNTTARGRSYRLDIHHPPWSLQPATATFTRNTMADAAGIALPSTPPLLHFSRRQDMVAWGPVPCRST